MCEEFVVPTTDLIANLGPGCYVQILDNNDLFWVEIETVCDSEYKGRVHPKLNTGLNTGYCPFGDDNLVLFCKEQITLLGCDRFCFC